MTTPPDAGARAAALASDRSLSDRRLEGFKQAARPFGIYVMALTVAGAIFAPWVPVDKIVLALTALGTLAGLRSLDKRITGQPNA